MKFQSMMAAAVLAAGMAQAQAPNQQDMQQMMNALGALMGGGTNTAKAVVDFRELKALLPAELPGFKRTNAKGERSGAMGMTVATAEGIYESEKGGNLSIKLTDMGGTGFLGGMASAAWASADVDNESDDGYERTTKIGGYKALEKYNTKDKDGEIQIMIAPRFMVEISGSSVEAAAIKTAAEKIDLKKLAGLQPKPPAQ